MGLGGITILQRSKIFSDFDIDCVQHGLEHFKNFVAEPPLKCFVGGSYPSGDDHQHRMDFITREQLLFALGKVQFRQFCTGTANIFMFTEPFAGWRQATARPTKTKVDWAIEMARLLEGHYAACEKVILVCDNLHTHTKRILRSLRTRTGAAVGSPHRVLLHPQARQLAQYCRERA